MKVFVSIAAIVVALLGSVSAQADPVAVQFGDGTAVVDGGVVHLFDIHGILDGRVNLENPSGDITIPQCYRTRAEAEAVCPQFFTYVAQNWSCFYCRLCEVRDNGEILCGPRATEYLRGSRLAGGQSSPGAVNSKRRRLAHN